MKNLALPGLDRLSPEMRQLVLFDYLFHRTSSNIDVRRR